MLCGHRSLARIWARGGGARGVVAKRATVPTGTLSWGRVRCNLRSGIPHRRPAAVHIPALQVFGLHPRLGNLPPRHQAAELAPEPGHWCPEALRLWQRQAAHQGRAERLLHLLSILSRAGANLWRDGLHYSYRRVVGWLCDGRAYARATDFPGRQRCGPAC